MFVRFQAQRSTMEGCYEFPWLVNPEYVSNVEPTENKSWSIISMNNGNEASVRGSIDEVEEKLREAR